MPVWRSSFFERRQKAGEKLKFNEKGFAKCSRTGIEYKLEDGKVVEIKHE